MTVRDAFESFARRLEEAADRADAEGIRLRRLTNTSLGSAEHVRANTYRHIAQLAREAVA